LLINGASFAFFSSPALENSQDISRLQYWGGLIYPLCPVLSDRKGEIYEIRLDLRRPEIPFELSGSGLMAITSIIKITGSLSLRRID
jgi:hypothetical protein